MHLCAEKDCELRAALERPTPRLGSVIAKQHPLEHVPIHGIVVYDHVEVRELDLRPGPNRTLKVIANARRPRPEPPRSTSDITADVMLGER